MEGDAAAPVLVVEDDDRSRFALAELLAPLGEDVLLARDGGEAIALSREHEPAVVLLDVALPGIDGFETARLLKLDEGTRHLPIIFLTAHANGDLIARGYEAGAVDYLLKPFEPEILRAKVSVFVDLFKLRRRAEALTRRALHDPLTGVPNRTLFLDRLQTAVARLERGSGSVARFGGDEFLVQCEGVDDAEAAELVRRIDEAARFTVAVDGRTASVSATIGLALSDDPAAVPEELIRAADLSMLAVKRSPAAL